VVVAVPVVRVMEVAADQVIHVSAVGYLLVPATRPVAVVPRVRGAVVRGRARGRVPVVHLKLVLVDVLAVRVVHVTVVQVIPVAVVKDRGVSAVVTVLVGVTRVGLVRHRASPFSVSLTRRRRARSMHGSSHERSRISLTSSSWRR
jgi:hypothetical protein